MAMEAKKRKAWRVAGRSQSGRADAVFIVLILAVAVAGFVLFIKTNPRASSAAAAPSPAGISLSNRIADFERMPTPERTRKLARIVTRRAEPCAATDAIYKGKDADGSAYYALTCANGTSWMVLLVNNYEGTNLVTSCRTMEEVGADCFEVWE
ncbi:MAG: hypothetical protein PVG38_16385 [Gammaproteobacteria bacterium]|jgi:hypothetical protein